MAAEKVDKSISNLFTTDATRESVGLDKLSYPEQAKVIFETIKSSIKVQAQALREIDKTIETKAKKSSS